MKEKLRQEAAGFTFSASKSTLRTLFAGCLLQALGIELKTAKIIICLLCIIEIDKNSE